jgi:uncharacterized membrane protein YfcA
MLDLALLFVVGTCAGTLNVIAGGGSLLALPALIFVGLPPTIANGTNRVAIFAQNIVAAWSFRQQGALDPRWVRPALVPVLIGAVLGAIAGIAIGDVAFQRVLAIVMLAIAIYMLWDPLRHRAGQALEGPSDDPSARLALALGWLGVGFYGGFIQAGLGFVILALISAAGLDLVRGNAVKVTVVLVYSPLALAIYAWDGLVDLRFGLALALGNMVGGRLGVHLTVLKGQRWLRPVVTGLVVLFALRLWFAA